jgi:predicted transcriptional regulator
LVKRRNSLDVVAHILQNAVGGATRTKLMYATGLSYKVTKEYVFLMYEKRLLDYEPLKGVYRPTEKGFQYLKTYEQMRTLSALIDVVKNEEY